MSWKKAISIIKILYIVIKTPMPFQNSHIYHPTGKEMYNYPGLPLAFDLIRERFYAQKERLNALDTKANFALTAATGLVSAGLVLQSLLLPHPHSVCSIYIPNFFHSFPILVKRALPLLPLLITYLIVMIIGYRAYKTRILSDVPTPRSLADFLPDPDYYIKAIVLSTMIEAYEENAIELNHKALLVDWAFRFLVLESAMLVLLLLYQGIC